MKGEARQSGFKLADHPRPAIAFTAVIYVLLGFLERLPGVVIPPLLYFVALGFLALYLMPYVLGLPSGRRSLRDYCRDIRLLPVRPVGRNVLLGLMLAGLALSSILLASLLTGHYVFDWRTVPALRWIKGLTRGIWEEVFFRGIILVLFMRVFAQQRKAVFWASFLFAMVHVNVMALSVDMIADVVSVFFIGLLLAYLVLETGSLLSGIIFHYVYDIFVLFVQNTPGADEPLASILLHGSLWVAIALGALLTRYVVARWPKREKAALAPGP